MKHPFTPRLRSRLASPPRNRVEMNEIPRKHGRICNLGAASPPRLLEVSPRGKITPDATDNHIDPQLGNARSISVVVDEATSPKPQDSSPRPLLKPTLIHRVLLDESPLPRNDIRA
ncbi:hypothetical protein CA85_48250 [Allorhodopirellula solitaria]|uniref:Uncharacterized protein n=1 Tax=Allorhodopirellula solitaria TaxID=2527987 RepID=A0A5C5X0M9_9BACT|nr:hypothetical protein CA85_48250 [Allorhodopirellula solitaria]